MMCSTVHILTIVLIVVTTTVHYCSYAHHNTFSQCQVNYAVSNLIIGPTTQGDITTYDICANDTIFLQCPKHVSRGKWVKDGETVCVTPQCAPWMVTASDEGLYQCIDYSTEPRRHYLLRLYVHPYGEFCYVWTLHKVFQLQNH